MLPAASEQPWGLFIAWHTPGSSWVVCSCAGFLYPFSGMTFSTCGVQGALGPIDTSLCAATYLPYGTWVNNPTFMHVDEGVQTWAAPATATYRSVVVA